MIPAILLIILTPPWACLAVWHFKGYYNGRY
jgi:hypothetical protein